jgi:hypothetical protein
MRIQLFQPRICEEAIEAVCEVLRSGWIGSGPRTQAFESAFASYVGAPRGRHCRISVACIGREIPTSQTPITVAHKQAWSFRSILLGRGLINA